MNGYKGFAHNSNEHDGFISKGWLQHSRARQRTLYNGNIYL